MVAAVVVLIAADVSVAGWLLSVRTAQCPARLRLTGVLLLLCAVFLLYVRAHQPNPDPPPRELPPTSTIGGPADV